jgi:hypothetical protein
LLVLLYNGVNAKDRRKNREGEKMKRHLILVIISSIWLLLAYAPGKGEQVQRFHQVQDVQAGGAYKGALRPDINFGKIPLYFAANQGQVNEKAFFYAKASRYTLWLTKEGLGFDSTHPALRAPLSRGELREPSLTAPN